MLVLLADPALAEGEQLLALGERAHGDGPFFERDWHRVLSWRPLTDAGSRARCAGFPLLWRRKPAAEREKPLACGHCTGCSPKFQVDWLAQRVSSDAVRPRRPDGPSAARRGPWPPPPGRLDAQPVARLAGRPSALDGQLLGLGAAARRAGSGPVGPAPRRAAPGGAMPPALGEQREPHRLPAPRPRARRRRRPDGARRRPSRAAPRTRCTRSGNSISSASIGVLSVLLIATWTADGPSRVGARSLAAADRLVVGEVARCRASGCSSCPGPQRRRRHRLAERAPSRRRRCGSRSRRCRPRPRPAARALTSEPARRASRVTGRYAPAEGGMSGSVSTRTT